jgi:predicted dehydrogenase
VQGSSATAGRVVLVGGHGHGTWHLRNLRRLAQHTGIRLVGVCDPRPLEGVPRELAGDVPVSPDLPGLLEATRPDVTIVCTPIHTHADLALAAVGAGTHVLLEKPPTPTLEEFHRLVSGVEASGRACQVGFQSLGSQALAHVRSLMADGAVGEVRGIGGACAWVRDASYWSRAPWAGRRALAGIPVVDGALTNPFAHAVASALAIAGATGPGSVRSIEVELYRANPIEADDTSCVRITTSDGQLLTVAATLAAERPHEPRLVVHGTAGRITLAYKTGEVRLQTGSIDETSVHPSVDLLTDLLNHVNDGTPLLVPLRATASFMEVVEAVRCAPDPAEVPAEHRRTEGEDGSRREVVVGVDDLVQRATETLSVFSELDVPWAMSGSIRERRLDLLPSGG